MIESIFKNKRLTLISVLFISTAGVTYWLLKRKKKQISKRLILDYVGNTPLIYLPKLSKATGSEIYCKMECMNPFGSSKDRPVKHMMMSAIEKGMFRNTNQVIEASSGSTAISLVQISKILGLKTTLYLPDDLADDKYTYLSILGANIIKVPQVSIVDSNHFFKRAQSNSKQNKSFFLNQFQNPQNFQAHITKTGFEIYEQTSGLITAFVCSAGTGGTIAGVSKYLKEKNEKIKVILADPQGSGLYNKVKYGVLFTNQQKQGYRLKNPFDTIIEGVGLNRQTQNLNKAIIDDAERVKDQEALHMAYYLIENQGLFVGSSSALNLAAAVKYSRKNKNQKIVTIVHDWGNRYIRKFYNQSYLKQKNIVFKRREYYQAEKIDFIE